MTFANSTLTLVQPTLTLRNAFLEMNTEYRSTERDQFDAIADVYRHDINETTFAHYLQQLYTATQPELVAAGRVPSKKIIQANGGVWQDNSISPATGRAISRYWIKLR